MERLSTIAVLLFCLIALPAGATEFGVLEQQGPKHDTLTVNPLALAFGSLQLEYEHAPSAGVSWFLAPEFEYAGVFGLRASSLGLDGGVRFFLTGAAPRGFFVSPKAHIGYADVLGISGMTWGLGGMAGYTWIFDNTWDVSAGAGLRFESYTFDVGNLGVTSGLWVAPDLRLAVGTTF